MKRLIWLVICCFLLMASVGCDISISLPSDTDAGGTGTKETEETTEDVTGEASQIDYEYVDSDWYVFQNADELIAAADVVFIGRVYDISFCVLNSVTEGDPKYELYTAYSIEPITAYKGETPSIYKKLYVQGGIREYKTDEQLESLKNYDLIGENATIPLWFEEHGKLGIGIEVGKVYLFAAVQEETQRRFHIMNPNQTFFSLEDPERENTVNGISISARDMVSVFGEDKWETLNNEWKNNAYLPVEYPTDEEYIAVADPIFKENFGFEDMLFFRRNVRIEPDGAEVYYYFEVCGISSDERYTVSLSKDLVFTKCEEGRGDRISAYMSDAFVAKVEKAKQKVIEDSLEYGEPHMYFEFAEGYLYVGAEFIVEIDPTVEEAPCGDHKHVFIKQNICDMDGNICPEG